MLAFWGRQIEASHRRRMIELILKRTGPSTTELKINVFYLLFIVRLTGEATPRTVFLLGVTDLKERYVTRRKME